MNAAAGSATFAQALDAKARLSVSDRSSIDQYIAVRERAPFMWRGRWRRNALSWNFGSRGSRGETVTADAGEPSDDWDSAPEELFDEFDAPEAFDRDLADQEAGLDPGRGRLTGARSPFSPLRHQATARRLDRRRKPLRGGCDVRCRCPRRRRYLHHGRLPTEPSRRQGAHRRLGREPRPALGQTPDRRPGSSSRRAARCSCREAAMVCELLCTSAPSTIITWSPFTSTESGRPADKACLGAMPRSYQVTPGHPRSATSDTAKASQATGRQRESESARRRSGPSPRASDVTDAKSNSKRETGSLARTCLDAGCSSADGRQSSGGGRPLLAGRLERVGERRGGVSDGPVGRDDLGQAVAGAGCVELLDGCIEARPELVWTAPSRSGRSSYGGRARSEPSIGRQARPASSARACASRIAAAASDNDRRRARKPASGGACSWARVASAHAERASRTALHVCSFAPARPSPLLGNLAHPTFLPHPAAALYATVPNLRLRTRIVRTNRSAAKTHRRIHTAILM